MLYPTLNQPLMLGLMLVIGLVSGLVFDGSKVLKILTQKDKMAGHLFDFLAVLFSFAILYVTNLKYNYGQFRAYVLLVFLAGLILERGISLFLWTKVGKKCYSIVTRRKRKNGEKEGG